MGDRTVFVLLESDSRSICLCGVRARDEVETMSMSSGDAEPVIFRPEYLLEVTNNDWKTFERFIEVFLKNCPEMIKRITEARRQGDLQELRRAAHTLRGSAGSFGAERLHAVAAELDTRAGRDSRITSQSSWIAFSASGTSCWRR